MIHIAQVIPGLERIGGAERQAILLAKGLRQRGYRVSMIALTGGGGSATTELARCDVRFASLEMRKGLTDPRGWIRLHTWLRTECPDVVHAHLPHAVWLARWSRLAEPMRALVDTLHTSSTGTLGRRLGYRWSRWLPDRVTAVSHAVADSHLEAGMARRAGLTILPNGVDTEVWRPDPAARSDFRRAMGLEEGFLWFTAGRLDPVKDYPTLLRAFVGLPAESRLVIAGGGAMEIELKKLCGDLGLLDRVRFLEFLPDVRPWMQAADGFVLASRWEGLPMTLLEAGACGLPVVATAVPGTREVVSEGITGFLAEPGDADALRLAMLRMMEMSPEDRCAMGERARRAVLDRFSLEVVLDLWEELYEGILKQNGVPQRFHRGRPILLAGDHS